MAVLLDIYSRNYAFLVQLVVNPVHFKLRIRCISLAVINCAAIA